LPYDEYVNVSGDDGKVVAVYYKVIVDKLVWYFNEVQKRNGRAILSSKSFGRQLRKFVPEMPEAWNVKCAPEWTSKQFNSFKIKSLKECREYFVASQNWRHKTWDDAKEFTQIEIDDNKWYKGW
jgi:hypothetical protein